LRGNAFRQPAGADLGGGGAGPGHPLDITAAQAQTAFAAHQNAQQSAGAIGALVRSHDGPIVDYLALHLLDGWNELSTALASQKIA
jgi:hypothetical protein